MTDRVQVYYHLENLSNKKEEKYKEIWNVKRNTSQPNKTLRHTDPYEKYIAFYLLRKGRGEEGEGEVEEKVEVEQKGEVEEEGEVEA